MTTQKKVYHVNNSVGQSEIKSKQNHPQRLKWNDSMWNNCLH